jgi:anti-repressor protein
MNTTHTLNLPAPCGGVHATMSSLEIAKLTGKNHADVLRDIRETLGQAEISLSKFAAVYLNSRNQEQPCFLLPRRECDLVISGYSVKYRLAIIDRWQELERATPAAPSMPEMLRIAAAAMEENERLKVTMTEQAPKVEFFDTVTSSASVCQLAVAAQTAKLPFGRNTLFQKLREIGVLITGGDRHNMPKQRFVTDGLFTVNQRSIENPKTGEPIVIHTTYATQKGLAWIVAKFGGSEEVAS